MSFLLFVFFLVVRPPPVCTRTVPLFPCTTLFRSFILMAALLERAGVIEDLFDVIYQMLGGLRGGLASASIIAATILAAMVGVVGATEVSMGIIALPAMLRRKYEIGRAHV